MPKWHWFSNNPISFVFPWTTKGNLSSTDKWPFFLHPGLATLCVHMQEPWVSKDLSLTGWRSLNHFPSLGPINLQPWSWYRFLQPVISCHMKVIWAALQPPAYLCFRALLFNRRAQDHCKHLGPLPTGEIEEHQFPHLLCDEWSWKQWGFYHFWFQFFVFQACRAREAANQTNFYQLPWKAMEGSEVYYIDSP